MADYRSLLEMQGQFFLLVLAGCHSNNLPMLRGVAEEEGVPLLRLIERVSAVNRKNPDRELARKAAAALKN